jgi:large-conductance mechanosensitive channel
MQKTKFWSWRACVHTGRIVQLVIIAFVLFIGVNAIAELLHKPILADRHPPSYYLPAAHAK